MTSKTNSMVGEAKLVKTQHVQFLVEYSPLMFQWLKITTGLGELKIGESFFDFI